MSATADAAGWFLGAPSATPVKNPADQSPTSTRGRTRIVPRALRQIVGMVTAESLGVTPNQVSVELGDDHGRLALTISTPIRVVSLQRVTREPALIARTGGTILARSATSQTEIRRRVGELTGADIGRVTVRLTGVDVSPERRVR
ncbi:hypothetical protein E3O25_04625 [Cryobacterium sp. TMT1-3]|uniref:Uncharacterized protein n=1 Tax=Cryobacterium luteum TaxID=1424661 RepID=A0A1H8BVD3_9MICO|nr:MULTISPECIES: hypothetical protein [Cryobacterium]TFB89139.1 hypothetical protein E3O10_09605 [Cryobacterium luteum]TFC29523.1 hypothetical protein E3O25_04625 [Cryobacterium sp. TMT1-3]SEM86549.1 Uncharacterized conserved protein YloU, alkaline shock protein (Asp23) family [Cryobacterium luteum]